MAGTGAVGVFTWFMIFLTLTGRADDGPPILNDIWSSNIATLAVAWISVAMWRLFGRPEDRS